MNQSIKIQTLEILHKVLNKTGPSSDFRYSGFEDFNELKKEIEEMMNRVRKGDASVLNVISFHFLPTGPFQELSIDNKWGDEFLELAKQFDAVYEAANQQK